MSSLASLRERYRHLAYVEAHREYDPRRKREMLGRFEANEAAWDAACKAEGVEETSPLAPVLDRWRAEVEGKRKPRSEEAKAKEIAALKAATIPPKPASTPTPSRAPKPFAGEKKAQPARAAKPTPTKSKSAKSEGQDPGETGEDEDPKRVEHEGDGDGKTLIAKGERWLESHAAIIFREIPEVKSASADPDEYVAAKRAFLDKYLPVLGEYIGPKEPKLLKIFKRPKAPSPLFAYCALYLADVGDLEGAIALCEDAIRLGQPSPIQRSYKEIAWDIEAEAFDAQALEVAAGKADKAAFYERRRRLLKSKFRSNYAKAGVNKTAATVAHALGDNAEAREWLLMVKVLDPNRGVETLLASIDKSLGEGKPAEGEAAPGTGGEQGTQTQG